VAEPAGDRVTAAGRAVGQLGCERFDGAGFERRAIEPAAPNVDRLAGPGPADRCNAQACGKRRIDARIDQGQIPAGDELDDARRHFDASVEADGERAERGDVFGGDDPDLVAGDRDHGAGADAIVPAAARDHHDRPVVEAARRRRAGGCRESQQGRRKRDRACGGPRAEAKACDGRGAHTRRIVRGP
jgi:hypothetical protein